MKVIPFTMDGVEYNVHVTKLTRKFSVMDTEKSGRTIDGEMYRDPIGTFFNYSMTVSPRGEDMAAMDAFWEAICQPVASHVCVFPYSDGLDLTQDFGVAIDFSNAKEFIGTFMGGPQRIGVVNCSSATSINQIFAYGGVSYIEKLILNENCTSYNQPFANCTRLTDITIEGVLSATVSFQWCPLTAESAKSVINCLKNYAGTSEANTEKITFSATTWGYLDAEGESAPNGTTWRTYISETLGWNI